jgi:hypothetical protein
VRNFLPYNLSNAFDHIGILGYALMIFVGGPIVTFLMNPTMRLIYGTLARIQGS